VDVARFARRPLAPAPRLVDLLDIDSVSRRQRSRDHVARDAALIGFVGERQQRARVAHRQAARRDLAAHFVGQLEQAQEFATDARSLPTARRCLPASVELVGEPAIGERLVDRVQISRAGCFRSAPSRAATAPRRRDVAHDDRHAQQAGELRGAPAALAGDDLEAIADLADDDRLDDRRWP
jgi:hypothetical protein